jgi:amyloid beta precursor protein binding protein 1
MGRLTIQLREHCVVDTHPDTTHTLRIDSPFPALESYARELKLEGMDSMDFSHVPWVVLLVRAAGQWKEEVRGVEPQSWELRC